MTTEKQQVAPSIDREAAKEMIRAVEEKYNLIRLIVESSISGKLPGISIAEILRASAGGGSCGIGCC